MNISFSMVDFLVIGPELVLALTAVALLVMIAFSKRIVGWIPYLAAAGTLIALFLNFQTWGRLQYGFNGMAVADNFALFFKFIFLFTTLMTLLMSIRYLRKEGFEHGEYYVLVLFAAVGMMLMACAADLIIIFLGLETFSLSIYVLAGFFRGDPRSGESALKYFLLGAFSTGFLLYGIALIYGAAGSTNLQKIMELLKGGSLLQSPFMLIGMGLLIVGFGFKVASVPFHMWTPDVYEGAPTSITAFMSVGPKAAGFAAFLRVFLYSLGPLQDYWVGILWTLAVITMTLGNITAIAQPNIKRMLAYSSIAHAGYILVGMVAGGTAGLTGILFYILAYALMNLGAFGIVILYGRKGEENVLVSDYRGMAARHPWPAAAMAVFMFSLAGIPPTAGFVGKFYIFSAAIDAGYIGLAIIGVLNSVISVYFYLRVVVMMYMRDPEKEPGALDFSPALIATLIIAAVGTLQMGITPAFYLAVAEKSLLALM